MATQLRPNSDPSVSRFALPASEAKQEIAAAKLREHGITVVHARNGDEARQIVLDLIPDGADVHHGASRSLEETGIAEAIETSNRYRPLRPRIWSLDRQTQGDEIRKLSSAPAVMLGSVHAITEDGSLLAASMSGSQLGAYVFGAAKVILVVGAQKIVRDVGEGMQRIYEYALPLEDARAQAAYGVPSAVNKIVIINREITPGRITVVLVDEVLGF